MNTSTTTTSAGVADESKVMVKLVSVLPQYEVPDDDIAVPSEIRRKGLSKVVNYLLGNEDSDDDSDNDIDSDGGRASPSSKVSFDFMVKNKFLRQSVAGYIRSASLSFESVLTIHFLPRSTKPSDSSPSDTLPDWVSSVAHGGPMLAVGCYDGVVRVFDPKGMGVVASASAHQAAVKAVAVCADKSLVASGGHDQALKLHSYDAEAKALTTASECGGHSASVEALSFSPSGLLASGDFAGGVCIYEVGDAAGGAVGGEAAGSKKRKVSGSGSEAGGVTTLTPLHTASLHTAAVTGVAWSSDSLTLHTASHDSAVRVLDVATQNPLLTLNGNKAVTCLAMPNAPGGTVLATGHPDSRVRLWDVRRDDSGGSAASFDATLKPSHRGYVTCISFDCGNPYQLCSSSHDGTVKRWDVRCSLPLYTVKAHEGGKEVGTGRQGKAMAVECGLGGGLWSGGSDGVVRRWE
mmetsp:Transcript_573/g.1023  ORF Transcript_573/g.1023 Transcript_573/m.1023 type:complete len:463 (+) Transcript_573:209-1597(+)